ncbi:MAG: MlaE family ABC transporter permease [Bacteroidales bacterium]
MRPFYLLGQYVLLMIQVFSKPEKWREFFKQLVKEIHKLGVDSIGIVFLISIFTGAVMCIQIQLNLTSPLMPNYILGLTTRDTLLLEFSSTIMCIILAGKVGSNIASEIGTMRITEQIDALNIMGINSANHLILPKVVGLMLFTPVLVVFSMFAGIIGGYIVAIFTDMVSVATWEIGLQSYFIEFYVWYSIIKSTIFAFIISSVASYHGYYSKGGALDVGKASTKSVVVSSVFILLFDVILTKLMLQ